MNDPFGFSLGIALGLFVGFIVGAAIVSIAHIKRDDILTVGRRDFIHWVRNHPECHETVIDDRFCFMCASEWRCLP